MVSDRGWFCNRNEANAAAAAAAALENIVHFLDVPICPPFSERQITHVQPACIF